MVMLRRTLLLTIYDLHVNIKYLPMMSDDPQKRYLLVGIDRPTRWVHMEMTTDKLAKTAVSFFKRLLAQCPVSVKTMLTDNGK